jgi:hypothetical protein
MTRERALIHRPGRGRRRHRAPPVDLARLVPIDKPLVRARYEFMETAAPDLAGYVDDWLARLPLRSG